MTMTLATAVTKNGVIALRQYDGANLVRKIVRNKNTQYISAFNVETGKNLMTIKTDLLKGKKFFIPPHSASEPKGFFFFMVKLIRKIKGKPMDAKTFSDKMRRPTDMDGLSKITQAGLWQQCGFQDAPAIQDLILWLRKQYAQQGAFKQNFVFDGVLDFSMFAAKMGKYSQNP